MSDKFDVEVDEEWCKGCGLCVSKCPKDVFEMRQNKAIVIFPERCVGCAMCENYCPDMAITVKKVKERSREAVKACAA